MSTDSDSTKTKAKAKAKVPLAVTVTTTILDPGWLGPCWASLVASEAEHDYETGAVEDAPAAESLVARSDERNIASSAGKKKKTRYLSVMRVAFCLCVAVYMWNTPQEFAIPREYVLDPVEETKNKNSPDEMYRPVHVARCTRSFHVCELRVPHAPSKFIWKFTKFVLYQRSLSPQSLRTLSLSIRIDRNTCIVTIAITQLLFTHAAEPNSLFYF